jgi:hypothetical protein
MGRYAFLFCLGGKILRLNVFIGLKSLWGQIVAGAQFVWEETLRYKYVFRARFHFERGGGGIGEAPN